MGCAAILFHWFTLGLAATLRIMPLGDSLTAGGYNLNDQYLIGGGYRVKLEQILHQGALGLDFTFVGSLHNGPAGFIDNAHEGHSGFRIDQLQAGVTGWLDAARPDVILLMIGTNDVIQGYDLDHAPDRFASLLESIEEAAPDAAILVASPIPTEDESWNAEIETYSFDIQQMVQKQARRGHFVGFVDMYDDAGIHHDRTDLIDGVHPNPTAYEKLSQVWGNILLNNIEH